MTQPVTINYAGRTPGWPRLAQALGIAGCLTGAIATGLALWPLPNFYKVPVGTSMRPMALTFWLCMCAAAGLFISFPLSTTCLALGWRDRRARWIASFGILLSLSAIFLGFWLYNWIITARNFILQD